VSLPVPLINRHRTESVLEGFGVSALVLADPTSIYQATGFWPQTVAMGQIGISFAVVPRDSTLPVTLVTSQFMHYLYDLDDTPKGSPLRMILYTAPEGLEGDAAPPLFFKGAEGGTPDPFEVITRESTQSLLAARAAYPDMQRALRAALADSGVEGLVAVDSFIPADLFGDAFAYRPADPLLRRIRMIKTPAEIALLRHAAQNNAQAARAAVLSVGVGSRYEELRRAFFAETGRRGGIPLFISTDSMGVRQRDGVIRAGRSFAIDAVSKYDHYHGDYGRTVFVGTPNDKVRHALDAAIVANDAMARTLRPGLRYSDITKAGREAVAKAGYDTMIACVAHSVGLFHTDEGFKDDVMNFSKADHLIEKDMVLSVDCPALFSDASGNVHLEELWLITDDGCEPLNDRDESFIQI
jgi:Xaa-Pro aminopeptidase